MSAVADLRDTARHTRAAPAVIDVEASGLGGPSYPIEIGFVLADGSSFCTLIRPPRDWTHWDPAAEAVHGLSRETLQRHGRSVADSARLLNERLIGQTVYSDAWGYDYPWIARLFDAAGFPAAFRIESLRALLSDDEARRWRAKKEEIRARCSLARHRASIDAWLLQQTWLQLQDD
jgi:hypothetical protein